MDYLDKIINERWRIEQRIREKYNISFSFIELNTDDEVKDFKYLFNNNDPKCKIFLWNAISYTKLNEVEKEKFTDEEYHFITQRLDFRDRYKGGMIFKNSNKNISTERLILKPATDPSMLVKYRMHLIADGDFLLYTGYKLNREQLNMCNLDRPYCFAVCEKTTGNMVGMVGLDGYDEVRHMAIMEWYTFKQYRCMGYAKEAVVALAKAFFEKKLFEWRAKLMVDTYKKHYANADLIRVNIRASNIASQNLAKACGFRVCHTVHRHFVVEGQGLEDAIIMELEPEDLSKVR